MPYKLLSLLGAVSLIAIYACRKEKSLETLVKTIPCSYSPYTVGSSFTYQYVNRLGDSSQYTLTVRADTVIEDRKYAILHDGYNDQFLRCDNGNYYLYERAMSLPDYELKAGDRLFLHDDYPAGATWNDTVHTTVSGLSQINLLQYRILERNVTWTVLGKTYRDVIIVKQDAAIIVGETTYPVGTIATYYYAPGVGYIETVSATDGVKLVKYTIR